jgi:hypothetical protein
MKKIALALTILLLTAAGAATRYSVAGGLEEFLAKFPDPVQIYFQTKTPEGVGFYTIAVPSGETAPMGVLGRSMDGAASAGLLVHEGPGADGVEDIFLEAAGEEPVSFGGPLRDLQPSVSPGGTVAFATETAPDTFDLALWDSSRGMRTLELGIGDETEPVILYAAPAGDGPVILLFQGSSGDEFQLYYAVIGPDDEILKVNRLFAFAGRALSPDLLNLHPESAPVDGDVFPLAFHGLAEDDNQRDLYIGELTFHGDLADPAGITLAADEPEQLIISLTDDKYPDLYRDTAGTLWCFFASYKDGDYDIYALDLGAMELYQLTDLSGTQTAPYVYRLGE